MASHPDPPSPAGIGDVVAHLKGVSAELREFLPSVVPRLDEPPSAVRFLREYVAQNRPVVISNAVNHWPALSRWQDDAYLAGLMGESEITVDVTPDGHGDCVVPSNGGGKDRFVRPEERRMTFSDFLALDKAVDGIAYLQHQCDCLNEEFPVLWDDLCGSEVAFAAEAFEAAPDAVNFWMGPDEAVSAMHKDPYENIYVVVRGTKTFSLLPPTDLVYLCEQSYPSGAYHHDADGGWTIVDDPPGTCNPWIPVDPDNPDTDAFPQSAGVAPFHVEVSAGDLLYLPSMWFHKVGQRADPAPGDGGYTVAVNFWYDMAYGSRYCHYEASSRLLGIS